MENMDNDYKTVPQLDKYEKEGIDESNYENMNAAERLQIDRDLNRQE